MKKFAIMAAFAALVGSASAAAISWGFGGQVYIADGDTPVLSTSYTDDVDWKLALVYVGQNADSFSIDKLTSDSVLDTMDYGIQATGKNAGKWNPATKTTSTTAYEDGASFAIVLFNEGAFDYVYALTSGAVGSAVTSATKVADMSDRGSATLYAVGGTGAANGVVKVSAVPEPGTAALALLGVGLLFKRRKA